MTYNRERVLLERLNNFLTTRLGLPANDYSSKLDLMGLLSLKTALSDINNLITVKLSLGLADWISEKYQLSEDQRVSMRENITKTKPNANGFDVWLGYPIAFVAEVKCNIPINGGRRYGAQQRQGIISDVKALMNGKSTTPMLTAGIPKFMAFLDLPEIREANEHLVQTEPELLTKLVFLERDEDETDTSFVHGVYINLNAT